MEISFYVTKQRLIELQRFMASLPTARFKYNPQKLSDNNWQVALTLDSPSDIERFNTLFNSWQQNVPKEEKQSIWQKLTEFWKELIE